MSFISRCITHRRFNQSIASMRLVFLRALLGFMFICSNQSAAGEPDELKIGYFELPPYSFADEQNRAVGVAIDHNNHLFEKLGMRVSYVRLPFVRLLQQLEQRTIDAALLLGKNKAREDMFVYPKRHYFEDYNSIIVKADSALNSLMSPSDLNNKSVLYIEEGYRSEFIRNIKLESIVFGDDYIKQMLKIVHYGRADAAYLPTEWSFRYQATISDMSDKIRVLRTPEQPEKFYMVFRINIGRDVIENYNRENLELISPLKIQNFIAAMTKKNSLP